MSATIWIEVEAGSISRVSSPRSGGYSSGISGVSLASLAKPAASSSRAVPGAGRRAPRMGHGRG